MYQLLSECRSFFVTGLYGLLIKIFLLGNNPIELLQSTISSIDSGNPVVYFDAFLLASPLLWILFLVITVLASKSLLEDAGFDDEYINPGEIAIKCFFIDIFHPLSKLFLWVNDTENEAKRNSFIVSLVLILIVAVATFLLR